MTVDIPNTRDSAPRERLLADFSAPTHEQWRAAAEAALGGAPFEKRLVTRAWEGIDLQPIYRAEDVAHLPRLREFPGEGGRARGSRASGLLARGWEISQDLPPGTPEAFNTAALAALERGQTELNVPLDFAAARGCDPDAADNTGVGAGGLSLATVEDLERALAGIQLPQVSIVLRPGTSGLAAAALLFAVARRRGVPKEALRGCVAIDPLGLLAATGSLPVSLDLAYREMAAVTRAIADRAPRMQTLAAQTHAYHDAGATAAQELGFALATGVEYIRALQARGVGADAAARHLRFAFSAGSNFFMEVAKFRAARLAWAQVARAFGVDGDAAGMRLHARTSTWNKTALDPHTNILRATTEALSAVIGGCDSLHVGPFDEVIRQPDEFSRRLARNTQVILAEECDLGHVIDPAGGSYYVEWLTDQVARLAWTVFQEIEQHGGMARALVAGIPQKLVATAASAKADAIAKRRVSIIGTNQYPMTREAPLAGAPPDAARIAEERAREIAEFRARRDAAGGGAADLDGVRMLLRNQSGFALDATINALNHGATLGEVCRALRRGDEPERAVEPLRIERAARPFERLREASAAHAGRTGRAPLVFQANVGPSRLYRLRADWTTNFFQVGGFEVSAGRDFADADEAARDALASGARVVVITATDETYPLAVEPFARAIKAADPAIAVLVAGAPREREAAWRAAGVDAFVNVATNALELLTRLLTRTGVLSP